MSLDSEISPRWKLQRPAPAGLKLAFFSTVVAFAANAFGQGTESVATNSAPPNPALTNLSLADFAVPLWGKMMTLRQTFGYKDNVLLSERNPQGSSFSSVGGDLGFYRLPANGWMFNFLLSADETHYFSSANDHDEQAVAAVAQWTRIFNERWRAGLGGNFILQNQVLDLTTTETNGFVINKVLANDFNERAFVRRDFDANWIEAEATGSRQFLNDPLDSYWQYGPKATIGRQCGPFSELTLSYQYFDVLYDTRTDIDLDGEMVPGTLLRFRSQLVDFSWRQYWDEARAWRLQTQLGFERNTDNGSGYFDYSEYRLLEKLEYAIALWKFSGRVRVGYYDYPYQTINAESSTLSSRYSFSTGLHAERALSRAIRLFADYSFDRSFSNVAEENYRANVVSAGIDWRF